MSQNNITLAPLQPEDREQFILHGPVVPEEEAGNWSEDDEIFVFLQ